MEIKFQPTGNKNFKAAHKLVNCMSEIYLFVKNDKEVAKMTTSVKNGKFHTIFELSATESAPFCIASSKHDYQEYSEREAIHGVGFSFDQGRALSAWDMLQKIEPHLGAKMFHITC